MKKMDEMQMSINLKAIRWSYLFTVISLFIWSIYEYIHTHTFTLAGYILIAQNLLYFLISNIEKWKMGDENGRNSIWFYAAGMAFFLVGFGILLFYFKQ